MSAAPVGPNDVTPELLEEMERLQAEGRPHAIIAGRLVPCIVGPDQWAYIRADVVRDLLRAAVPLAREPEP